MENTKILGIAGTAGAGKSGLSRFIHAAIISSITVGDDENNLEYLAQVALDDDGYILVKTDNSAMSDGMGRLDLSLRTPDFIEYMSTYIWRFVREINLADPLKEMLCDLHGAEWWRLNGTHEDKNALTNQTWAMMPGKLPKGVDKNAFVTERERAAHWGEFLRNLIPNFWEDNFQRRVESCDSELVICADVRHANSIDRIHEMGGKVIYLPRNPYQMNHSSETSIQACRDMCDAVIPNEEMTLKETHEAAFKVLVDWGFLETE